ncbi:Alpha/Beta hydrolase protein [Tuber indicum]|nr:Alpha/Beta hydrolase protein [Tuber indicum]
MSDPDSIEQIAPAGPVPDRKSAQIVRGLETVIHGLDTYVYDGSHKAIIVIIPDAFGWRFTNTRLIADEIGDRTGATVFLPDFMNGDSYPLKYNNCMSTEGSVPLPLHLKLRASIALKLWRFRHRDSKCAAIIQNFFQVLYTNSTDSRIFAAGYSWGAKQAMLLASNSHPAPNSGQIFFVEAIYAASPLKLSFPQELYAVQKPICLALGSEDELLPKDSIDLFKNWIMQGAPPGSDIHVYPGAPHDFAVQAEFGKPGQKYNKRAALLQAEKFFNKIFDGPIMI